MSYRRELSENWQPLLAASIGMSLGLALNHYVSSLFMPELMKEFGWSRAQAATIGSTAFIGLFLIPFAGRLVDQVGARTAVVIGFVAVPVGYLALSMMTGSFAVFFAIQLVKSVLGTLTTTMVFARVVVERFNAARGFALSIVMSAAPLTGAIAVPLIAGFMEEHGWRSTYHLLAAISALGGVVTWWLLGDSGASKQAAEPRDRKPWSWREFRDIMRYPAMPLALGGMLLVNIPQVIAASQLKLVLLDSDASEALAIFCISLYAAGVAGGRILSGLALDRIPVHKVAIMTLGLPAIGLAAVASPFDQVWVLAGSVLLIALAQGAEGDIGAYLISRKFPLQHYSLLMAVMTGALTIGSATGSLALGYVLHTTDSYAIFLYASAALTLVGAALFYLTGRYPLVREAEAEAVPA